MVIPDNIVSLIGLAVSLAGFALSGGFKKAETAA